MAERLNLNIQTTRNVVRPFRSETHPREWYTNSSIENCVSSFPWLGPVQIRKPTLGWPLCRADYQRSLTRGPAWNTTCQSIHGHADSQEKYTWEMKIRGMMKVENISMRCTRGWLRRFVNVNQSEQECVGRRVMKLALPGNRRQGRPNWGWLDHVASDMQNVGIVGEDMFKRSTGGDHVCHSNSTWKREQLVEEEIHSIFYPDFLSPKLLIKFSLCPWERRGHLSWWGHNP